MRSVYSFEVLEGTVYENPSSCRLFEFTFTFSWLFETDKVVSSILTVFKIFFGVWDNKNDILY